MAMASSQDSSALIDQSIPQWKRELILRRRALARTLPAGNTSVKLTCPSVVTAVRQAEQGAAVENVSGKQQRCISSAIASNKGLLDQAQADFHPRGRISDSSSPSTTVTAAVVGNMRLVEHHADACTDLMINGVGLDTNTLSIDPNSLKYRAKMGEEKSIKKSCASSRTIMDNSVVMSENNNCSHPHDEECQSDSSEELQYGPGIVNKLKSKYMSMTLRENQNRGVRPSLANMRRAASLENMLDSDDLETGKPQIKTQYRFTKRADAANNIGKIQHTSHHQQRYRGISRGNDSMKRARSVETLYRYDTKCNAGVVPVVANQLPVSKSCARDVNKNSAQVIKPVANDEIIIVETKKTIGEDRITVPQQQKMRTSSVATEGELPPPDLVKQTLKIFEGSPVRKSARVPGKAASGATKTHGYKNANLPKLNSNANQNINLSGSSSKPLLSPKPSPEKIRRNTATKPPSPRKVVPASTSPDPPSTSPTVPNRLVPLETSHSPPSSPTSTPSVGVNKLKSSPTTEIKKPPIALRDSSDSEPPSLSPVPYSSPVVNGRTDSINLLTDDDPSSDEDTTDGITKSVSRSALENIRKDGMSMQFSFNTNGTGTSSDKSKSHLPSVKSAVTSGQSRVITAKLPSPVIEKIDSPPPAKPMSSLSTLKSPDSPQTQQKQMAVIRPIVTSKVSPATTTTTSMSLTDREIEKNMINREKSIEPPMCKKKTIDQVSSEVSKGRVEDSVKNVLPNSLRGGKESKGPGLWDNKPWHQQGQNTMKFDFSKCKDPIPPYIENDGLILAPKREKLKPGESVIILKNPGAGTESTDGDLDEYSAGFSGPPSPCNVLFEGGNVLINGRSNLRKQPRQGKLRITFNDAATTTYEYPSEASFLNEAAVTSSPAATSSSNGEAPTMPLPPSPSGSTPGVPFGGSSLASYTPSKVHLGGEDFQLGVTRSTPHTGKLISGPDPPLEPVTTEDYLKPAEDSETVAWSAETAADLLF